MHLKQRENVISEYEMIIVVIETKNCSLWCYIKDKYAIIKINL